VALLTNHLLAGIGVTRNTPRGIGLVEERKVIQNKKSGPLQLRARGRSYIYGVVKRKNVTGRTLSLVNIRDATHDWGLESKKKIYEQGRDDRGAWLSH